MTAPAPPAIVFTDLDGTLLDHDTYSWEAAAPALSRLAAHDVPVVPSTSKTLAELRLLAPAIGFRGPGIAENGAVVGWRLDGGGEVSSVGADYPRLRAALARLREELGLPLVGFGDVDAAGVAARTDLEPAAAERARERWGDEPFWSERPLRETEVEALERAVRSLGLGLTRGGRFFHLTGGADKGAAAERVTSHYAGGGPRPRTAAFGDSANDDGLLAFADHAYVVRGPGGTVEPSLGRIPGVTVTEGIGPEGFREGVDHLLNGPWRDLGRAA